ncbi:MAG TPA: 4Fe-4S dicluster domain-containing protein [Nitrospira sp.]|nr:4Fe-4S dicluster domain-containing protein [Nitrospira sp.]
MANDPSYGRREFVKDSVRSVAKAAKEFAWQRDAAPAPVLPPVRTDWLRPPGAVDDALFLERCTRCGDCIKVCPPGAIVAHVQDGTPIIFADRSPCLLCDDLPCIAACSVEALLPVEGVGHVRMGLAAVSHRLCTAGHGCHACVSKCPTNALGRDLDSLQLVVTPEACVGCGMCEAVCKTVNDHIAIRVTPARQLVRTG